MSEGEGCRAARGVGATALRAYIWFCVMGQPQLSQGPFLPTPPRVSTLLLIGALGWLDPIWPANARARCVVRTPNLGKPTET